MLSERRAGSSTDLLCGVSLQLHVCFMLTFDVLDLRPSFALLNKCGIRTLLTSVCKYSFILYSLHAACQKAVVSPPPTVSPAVTDTHRACKRDYTTTRLCAGWNLTDSRGCEKEKGKLSRFYFEGEKSYLQMSQSVPHCVSTIPMVLNPSRPRRASLLRGCILPGVPQL